MNNVEDTKRSEMEEEKSPETEGTKAVETEEAEAAETEEAETAFFGGRNLKGAIEAILFTMGDSVEFSRIGAAIGQDSRSVRRIVEEMKHDYEQEDRGIRIMILEDACQLCTKKEYYDVLIELAMNPRKPVLTDVMLETLAIIAYKQPVTKMEIEKIRGVNSNHAVNRLLDYRLIRELGRLDVPGRPILFGTSEEFLRCFGVEGIDELPAIDPVRLEEFKAEAEEEIQITT